MLGRSREEKTFCRICIGYCGLTYSFDEAGAVAKVQGDRENPLTRGYACIKGLTLHEAHASEKRLLWPLKREKDGSFQRIPLEQALDEIAERLRAIIAEHGADAVGCFRGTQSYLNSLACAMQPALMAAIPLPNAEAYSAPSSLAICRSTRDRVGLPLRV